MLTVTGRQGKEDEKERQFLHRGIAGRALERLFRLADHVQVTGAKLENGLPHIELVRNVPEAMKPRRVLIGDTIGCLYRDAGAVCTGPEVKLRARRASIRGAGMSSRGLYAWRLDGAPRSCSSNRTRKCQIWRETGRETGRNATIITRFPPGTCVTI